MKWFFYYYHQERHFITTVVQNRIQSLKSCLENWKNLVTWETRRLSLLFHQWNESYLYHEGKALPEDLDPPCLFTTLHEKKRSTRNQYNCSRQGEFNKMWASNCFNTIARLSNKTRSCRPIVTSHQSRFASMDMPEMMRQTNPFVIWILSGLLVICVVIILYCLDQRRNHGRISMRFPRWPSLSRPYWPSSCLGTALQVAARLRRSFRRMVLSHCLPTFLSSRESSSCLANSMWLKMMNQIYVCLTSSLASSSITFAKTCFFKWLPTISSVPSFL